MSVLIFALGFAHHVLREVDHDAAHPLVGRRVDDLFAVALGAQETARAQEAQVVAHKCPRDAHALGKLANRGWLGQAREEDAQPRGLAEKPQHIGHLRDLLRVERRQLLGHKLHDNARLHISMSSVNAVEAVLALFRGS